MNNRKTLFHLFLNFIAVTTLCAQSSWVTQRKSIVFNDDKLSQVVRPLYSFRRLALCRGTEVSVRCRQQNGTWQEWRKVVSGKKIQFKNECSEYEVQQTEKTDETVEVSADFLAHCVTPSAKVEVIERKNWGAEKAANAYRKHQPVEIILHHSWRPNHASYRELKTVRGIQRYHMHSPYTGWDDIGYHYLVGPDGLVYRGRPEDVVGAHCVPNSGKVGICLIGDHDEGRDPVNESTWTQVENLVLEIADRYDIPPEKLNGHCDYSSKTCPGYVVYKRFSKLRKKFETIGFDPTK